jgi:hypothetical protein
VLGDRKLTLRLTTWRHALATSPLAGPLLLNLLCGIATRLIVPITPNPGDGPLYLLMSDHFPLLGCGAFHCYRFLGPLLASLLPLARPDAFMVLGLAANIVTGTVLWLLARRLGGSPRVALVTGGWYWTTLGAIQTITDPLMLPDPLAVCWSTVSLYLLIARRYVAGLLVLLVGTAVKEIVLVVPLIYACYVFLARDDARHRLPWLATLLVVPIIPWLAIRFALRSLASYTYESETSYIVGPYLAIWLDYVGPLRAVTWVFTSWAAAWFFAVLGLWQGNTRQRAILLASALPMAALVVLQTPERALASFPFAVLIPAGASLSRLPTSAVGLVLAANGLFTISMAAKVAWLPPPPFLLAALGLVLLATLYIGLRYPRTQHAPA